MNGRQGPRRQQRPATMGATGVALALVLALGGAAAAADKPDAETEPLLTAAFEAVAKGETAKTKMAGFTIEKKTFSTTPWGGSVLVGFDVGLGKFLNSDVIYALRAIYLTPKGD